MRAIIDRNNVDKIDARDIENQLEGDIEANVTYRAEEKDTSSYVIDLPSNPLVRFFRQAAKTAKGFLLNPEAKSTGPTT
jgi:hypothetical protein